MGAKAGRGAGEDRAPGAGVRRPQGGPGHAAQEEDGSAGDQNEANHHQGWTLEKGTNFASRPMTVFDQI